jgi:hypothetical protein
MKKIIILKHGDGELANQLWNFVSIYAYCKEKDYLCQNPSFFEYGKYFDIIINNKIIEWLFFVPFKNSNKRRYSLKNRFYRFLYKIYANLIYKFKKNKTLLSIHNKGKKYFLPPTKDNIELNKIEKKSNSIYFVGWLFRNPVGIKKFRKNIVTYFRPKDKYIDPLEKEVFDLRKKYKNILGVHIRQSDYKTHKGGKYYVKQNRMREIIDEYLKNSNTDQKTTIFIIASDENIDTNSFTGLNIINKRRTAIEDLFLLSLCDIILGSDSSFSHFASYYGNIPHIIFKNEQIDWNYYEDKKEFFENKYCTLY